MQKDIRHYDMKEVEFEQDRSDRKFLTLEVSTRLTLNVPEIPFFDVLTSVRIGESLFTIFASLA